MYALRDGGGVMKRLRDACRTNEPQATMTLFLGVMCPLVACVNRPHAPVWMIFALGLVWPALAFMGNLIDPIPADDGGKR